MDAKNTIKQWAKDDRPREKMISLGAENLSDSELLAILIHNGTPKKSAVDLAKEVLQLSDNDLNELGKLSIKDLTKVKGIGEAKAITIAAALELGRRRQAGNILNKKFLTNSKDIGGYLQERYRDMDRELFGVVYMNIRNKILGIEILSEGGIASTIVDTRIILKKALEKTAVNLVLFHNHPSGNPNPSEQDKKITDKLRQAAKIMEMNVIDHIIVSESGYLSFADQGYMD
ncbi:MAG TPA: DNA repair protein RadC [Niabella sp.]|nr:DNA repair protein RadC [Chitinophagaceae bacterium]HRO85806.1 DNA repair protein RadC [Niabella sp.]